MAPFLTHLVIGERVWQTLKARTPAPDPRRSVDAAYYGTFLFGCLAPDVDKFCPGLEQATTHFLPKDEGYAYARQRSQHFLDRQDEFLRAPFAELHADERTFVLGYVCHVATDEIAARQTETIEALAQTSRAKLPGVDAALTALDPRLWAQANDPEGLIGSLATAAIPGETFPFAPAACLRAMHQIVLPQVHEGGGLEPFLRMVRRHRHWLRCGCVSDASDDPDLEAELASLRRRIEADLPTAEDVLDRTDLNRFLEEAVAYSLERIGAMHAPEGLA